MTERLTQLLEHTADEWARDAVAPSWTSVPPRRSLLARLPLRALAPVLAAAAVVAVAVPVALLTDRVDEPTGYAAAGPVVVLGPDEEGLPRSTDAGSPLRVGEPRQPGPSAPLCEAEGAAAVLDLSEGVLRVTPRQQPAQEPSPLRMCLTPGGLRLELVNDVQVRYAQQPDVPNPPAFGAQILRMGDIAMLARWEGQCDGLPDGGTLQGLAGGTVPVTVQGSPPGCGDGAGRLTLGPVSVTGVGGAVVPEERAGLKVDLRTPQEIPRGGPFTYDVALQNPTSSPISLRPCPTYAIQLTDAVSGQYGRHRLPCERMPAALAPRQELVIRVVTMYTPGLSDNAGDQFQFSWGIAGVPAVSALVRLLDPEPGAAFTVPYRAPSADPGTPTQHRYRVNGAFPIVIEGDRSVAAGSVLRYRAVVNNRDPRPIPLRPCPVWAETLVVAPGEGRQPKPARRYGEVNCADAPEQIAPGETVTFEMQTTVPADAPAGPHQLFWELYEGVASEPFDLTVTR